MNLTATQTRLHLILSLLFRPSTKWYRDITQVVLDAGFNFSEVTANQNPLDVVLSFSRFAELRQKFPCYDHLRSHDFGAKESQLWCSEPEVARFVADMVFASQSRTVVETGTYVGYATCHLATALQHQQGYCELYTIDGSPDYLRRASQNLSSLGLNDNVRLICGRTQDGDTLRQVPNSIDFIFLDSDHTYFGVKEEFERYLPRLSENGIAVVHDTVLHHGVRKAVGELMPRYRIATIATSRGCGISIVQKQQSLIRA